MSGTAKFSFPATRVAEVPAFVDQASATDDSVLLGFEETVKAMRDAVSGGDSVWNDLVRVYAQSELTRDTYGTYVLTFAERMLEPEVWDVCKVWFTALVADPEAYSTAFAESLINRLVNDVVLGPLTMIVDGFGWLISVSAAADAAMFKDLLPDASVLPDDERMLLQQLVADGEQNLGELVAALNHGFEAAGKMWDHAAAFLDRPVLDVLEISLMIAQTITEVVTEAVASDELLKVIADVGADPAAQGALHGNIVGFVMGFVIPGADQLFFLAASGKLFSEASAVAKAAGVFEQAGAAALGAVERPGLPTPRAVTLARPGVAAAPGILAAAPRLSTPAQIRALKVAETAELFKNFEVAFREMLRICGKSRERLQRRLSARAMAQAGQAAEHANLSIDAVRSAGTVANKLITSIHGLDGSYDSVRRITSRVNARVWFLSALNPEVLAHGATNWDDVSRALSSTRLFEAAHLPLDSRFLELPTTYLAQRQLQQVLREVHPTFPGVMQATDMNAVAVLGGQHRTSVNRLLGPERRSLTDTMWLHPTLTNRMNAAIVVDQYVRRGQVLAEGTLVVTESTPLKAIIDASGRVLSESEFKPVWTKVAPLLAQYRAALP
jgi:hypothetical protein